MTSLDNQLVVKSHVARDLLQNAALFKTDKLVVWEYVSNGLQYVDAGTNPLVRVTLESKKRKITISDNGRGMDWDGINNFFVMHGENIDRREGKPGRGRFGTGKSAAFGIAGVLQVRSVRHRKRCTVQLTRSEVDNMRSDGPIPVLVLERSIATSEPNGTIIEIEDVHLKSLDQDGIVHYVERHLARWPKNCTVFVNTHECEYAEPAISFQRRFQPEGELKDRLGDTELVIKISKGPLEVDLRGVSIYANGVWHETTLAGSEGREMSQYIFGEIDVARLDDDNSSISPFDLSRSMRLNPANETVRAAYAFISVNVEQVRRELVESEKKRRTTEESQKLAEQASEIARIINEDFAAFRQRIARVKAKAKGTTDLRTKEIISDAGEDLIFGLDTSAEVVTPTGDPGNTGGMAGNGHVPSDLMPQVRPGGEEKKGRIGSTAGGWRKSVRGGFEVGFKPLGRESHRAQYVPDERTIYINLDHPQVVAAKGLGTINDPAFVRLSYEIAFAEYAVALASELNARDEYNDPGEPIFDIRDTLNRLALKAAPLYSA